MHRVLPMDLPTDLSFLQQHLLAMFVPITLRGKMYRYYSYSRPTVKGEKNDGPPADPPWIAEGRYTVEGDF